MKKLPFIVGEVSENWQDAEEIEPSGLLCSQFERMINVNFERGYTLHSFQIHRLIHEPGIMNETLIAVFRLMGSNDRTRNRNALEVGASFRGGQAS